MVYSFAGVSILIFNKITIKNFFSYGNQEQSIQLDEHGIFLIVGENGSGKSCIVDAIVFALFGQITKKTKMANIVNERIGKDCEVKLFFQSGGKEHIIVRYKKHRKFGDQMFFYIDNDDVSKSNKSDTQKHIESIIRFNYKSFVNSIMMSQETIGSFIECEPAKKKQILENILQINDLVKYYSIVQNTRKDINTTISILEQNEISINNTLDNIKESIENYQNSCNLKKKENEKRIKELESKLKNFTSIDEEKEQAELEQRKKERDELKRTKDTILLLEKEISRCEKDKDYEDNIILQYKETITNLLKLYENSVKNFEKNQGNFLKIKKLIDEAKKNPNICPVCHNEINISDHKKWLKEKNNEMSQIKKDILNGREKQSEYKDKIEKFKEKIQSVKNNINKIKNVIKKKNKELLSLRDRVALSSNLNSEDIDIREKELLNINFIKTAIKERIDTLKEGKIIDMDFIKSMEDQLKEATKKKEDNDLKMVEKKNEYLIMKFWENSFSSKKNTLKSWCINNILGFLNSQIRYYINRFFTGNIELTLDSELNERIYIDGRERDFGQFSGGQKRRLNLSILFSLNSLIQANVGHLKILFLDEILSNFLDDDGISSVLQILEDRIDETIFIIEHRENFKNYPNFKPIKVFKNKNDFSIIERV